MDYSETIHFDTPLTQAELVAKYAKARFPGDPRLVFEEISNVDFEAILKHAHHSGLSEDDFRQLLKLRLNCRID